MEIDCMPLGRTKQFFFEKRTKKLLFVWVEPIRQSRSQNRQEFFASFFQKRRPFFRAQIHISKPAGYIQNERLGALWSKPNQARSRPWQNFSQRDKRLPC
jgi:hypothetical protein